MRAPHSWLNHLPKPHILIPSSWGLEFNIWIFLGGEHKHSGHYGFSLSYYEGFPQMSSDLLSAILKAGALNGRWGALCVYMGLPHGPHFLSGKEEGRSGIPCFLHRLSSNPLVSNTIFNTLLRVSTQLANSWALRFCLLAFLITGLKFILLGSVSLSAEEMPSVIQLQISPPSLLIWVDLHVMMTVSYLLTLFGLLCEVLREDREKYLRFTIHL